MKKSDIRKEKLKFRLQLSHNEIGRKSQIIFDKLLVSNQYLNADILLCYSDFKGEVKTEIIIRDALNKGKSVFLPKVNPDTLKMEFYRINDCDLLESGYMGIYEPSDSAELFDYSNNISKQIMMLVPGVSFSDKLYRIGYGKGFYDKYLTDKPLIYKCGIAYSEQICCECDDDCFDDFDIRMDSVITDDKIYFL